MCYVCDYTCCTSSSGERCGCDHCEQPLCHKDAGLITTEGDNAPRFPNVLQTPDDTEMRHGLRDSFVANEQYRRTEGAALIMNTGMLYPDPGPLPQTLPMSRVTRPDEQPGARVVGMNTDSGYMPPPPAPVINVNSELRLDEPREMPAPVDITDRQPDEQRGTRDAGVLAMGEGQGMPPGATAVPVERPNPEQGVYPPTGTAEGLTGPPSAANEYAGVSGPAPTWEGDPEQPPAALAEGDPTTIPGPVRAPSGHVDASGTTESGPAVETAAPTPTPPSKGQKTPLARAADPVETPRTEPPDEDYIDV